MFLKKPDAKLENGLRGFRAIALLIVFSEWCTTVFVDLLHEEKEPEKWKSLHVGTERGVNCEHACAGPGGEHIPEALGMEGGQADRPATWNVHIQYSFHGELGCEDGTRRGQALTGI